jgi:hypothetical protein
MIEIVFSRTLEESIEAQLAFAKTSAIRRRFRWLTFPAISLGVFLTLLSQNWPLEGSMLINGRSYSYIINAVTIAVLAFFSIVLGGLVSAVVGIARRNAIVRPLRSLPREAFGKMSLKVDDDGLTVHAPLAKTIYDWRLITHLRVTPHYLFFCGGASLIASVPISVLETEAQQAELVAETRRLIARDTSDTGNDTSN